jgi:hypothetical protein
MDRGVRLRGEAVGDGVPVAVRLAGIGRGIDDLGERHVHGRRHEPGFGGAVSQNRTRQEWQRGHHIAKEPMTCKNSVELVRRYCNRHDLLQNLAGAVR